MISYEEALNIILKAGGEKKSVHETIGVENISGRICAEDIFAPVANQPFDNSAMDGFALRMEDLAQATNDNPAALEMIGHIAAGDTARFGVPARGQCYEIMTGAPLPQGCDTVVPVEKTEKKGDRILFRAVSGKGENIRRAGEDFQTGDLVLEKGSVLDANHILALATLGIGEIKVLKRIRAALISTGREVVDELGAPLETGRIYNSTRPYLMASLTNMGVDVEYCGAVPDEPDLFRKKLMNAVGEGADIVISTGAVSAGVHDFVPSVLKEAGAEILFHKVAIRPGKPILFARLPGGAFFFGLPGNPVSSAVGLRFFLFPLLRAFQGLPPEKPLCAILRKPWRRKGGEGLRFFVRLGTGYNKKAVCEAEIVEGQQSFKVRPFVSTGAWGVIGEEIPGLEAGDVIGVYPDIRVNDSSDRRYLMTQGIYRS
jgi:molybdopterin molybdotransferase